MLNAYLCPGDATGWAIDEDRRLTAMALEGVARLVDEPAKADVVHSCWWPRIMEIPDPLVRGKAVVCHMAGRPARVLGDPGFASALGRVTHWVAQSREALEELRAIARRVSLVPYAVDADAFAAPPDPVPEAIARAERALPRGAYVVVSVQRDSAGAGLDAGEAHPKLVKGPDVFVEVLGELRARGENVVALLVGPRRHWIRGALARRQIPYVFVGREVRGDDYPGSIVGKGVLAHAYSMADLCLVTSRSEGGPRCVLEAAAAGTPVLATRVGLAPDVLAPECLYDDFAGAVEKIQDDIRARTLQRHVDRHASAVRASHVVSATRAGFAELYESLERRPATRPSPLVLVEARPGPGRGRRVCFWNKFTPPPWGGGNQFMLALKGEAERLGYETTINGEGPPADGHVVNSVQFDIEKFERQVVPGQARVVHRIDGPISVLRGTPESLDQDRRCFEFNARHATSTVVQSWHTMRALAELGFEPVRPTLIHNACDPAIFHPPVDGDAPPHEPGRRIKVIATCWSPSPGKGAAIYEWMGWHLDPSRFELTFVGNCPARLHNWTMLPALPSEPLAALLRTQDVYVTASRNDPCSNALIEAMSCGLPALYLDSGGHPELAGMGGLAFRYPREIPAKLANLARHRAAYARLLTPASLEGVARAYLRLIFDRDDPSPAR